MESIAPTDAVRTRHGARRPALDRCVAARRAVRVAGDPSRFRSPLH